MSMIALARPTGARVLEQVPDGQSDAAGRVRKSLEEILDHSSKAARDWTQLVMARLTVIQTTCSLVGWDGYEARPVSPLTTERTGRFLVAVRRSLPRDVPAPDLVPESDGEISLTWEIGPHRLFSISVGESLRLAYAGLLGDGVERHGVEPFDGMVPAILAESIKELYQRHRAAEGSRAA